MKKALAHESFVYNMFVLDFKVSQDTLFFFPIENEYGEHSGFV